MILTQILQPTCIKVPLDGKDKDSAITELVDMLVASKQIEDRDAILEAILIREETRSTGIGSGIAIPHGKCNTVKELVMAIGIAKDGIEFDSIDQKPVSIIVLLASPLDRTGPHIQALARISRLMLDDKFKDQLQNASSAEDVYDLINNKEHE
jgi:fructose-specific phosphotransferase system IIA component